MTLTIDLPPAMDERLEQEAERGRIEPAQLVLEAVDARLSNPSGGQRSREWQPLQIPPPRGPLGVKTIDEHLRKRREAGLEERPFYETATPAERIQALHEWAEGHKDWPVLPPEADSREFLYEELTLRTIFPDEHRE